MRNSRSCSSSSVSSRLRTQLCGISGASSSAASMSRRRQVLPREQLPHVLTVSERLSLSAALSAAESLTASLLTASITSERKLIRTLSEAELPRSEPGSADTHLSEK